MQGTKQRHNELDGIEDRSNLAENDRERPSEDDIARRAYERYEARGGKTVMRLTTGWTPSET